MKKLWQLCACAAGVLAGLWLTARILLPVGLPFLLGLGLARLARPLAARLRRLPRGLAAFLSVTAVCLVAAAVLTGLGWALWQGCAALCARLPGLLSSLAEPLQRLHAAALHLASRLPDGMGEAAAQWVDRLFAGGSVVADSVSQGVFGCVTRVLGWMPQLLLFGLTALLSAYFLAGDAPRLRALAARHVPEEWRARGGQLLVRLRAALRGYVLAQGKLLLVTFGVVSLGLLAALRRPHAVDVYKRQAYDYIFIDCPPSLELLTLNALCAADSVLIPVQCEYYALEGLSDLMGTLRAIKRRLNPKISVFGVLLTMYDGRTNFSNQVAQEVRRHFPGKVYANAIPRNVRLAEAPSHGLPVIAYDRSSRGAAAYLAVAEEIRRKDGSL